MRRVLAHRGTSSLHHLPGVMLGRGGDDAGASGGCGEGVTDGLCADDYSPVAAAADDDDDGLDHYCLFQTLIASAVNVKRFRC